MAPWAAGADQVRPTVPLGLATASGVPGAAGTVVDAAWFDGPDVAPVPTELVALTVKV